MRLNVLLVQFQVSFSVAENLAAILRALESAQAGDLVLCPEGCLSGYDDDLSFLARIDTQAVGAGLTRLAAEASHRSLHIWVGAVTRDGEAWVNQAHGFTPVGEVHIYRKVNLATHERGTFTAGSELPIFHLNFPEGEIAAGVQICRELRFPEQWGWLARQGAQVILHLNNAVGDATLRSIWRSHLVSRAAETQRFVISANNGAPGRQCPTMAVAPDGQLLGEIAHKGTSLLHVTLDLKRVSNWYLSQAREDVVAIRGK